MAEFNPTYLNLAPYEAALAQRRSNQVNALDALLGGVQQGVQIQRLPQTIQENQIAQQLNQAIQAQKLRELQTGKIIEVGNTLVRQNPDGSYESVFTAPVTSTGSPESQQFIGFDANQQPIVFGPKSGTFRTGTLPAGVSMPTGGLLPKTVAPETQTFTGFNADGTAIQFGNRGSGITAAPVQGNLNVTGPLQPKTEPVKSKSILAVNEKTGRVTNVVLNPGEALPEGFKQQIKDADDFKNIQSFRKEVADNPVIKQFASVQQYKQRIDDAIEEAKTTNNFVGVDQTLISAFNRLNEPDSVTMVSEYARTSADAPIINRIKANIARITEGGRLSQEERDALARLSNRIYQTSLSNYSKTTDWIENIAEKNSWDPNDIIQPLQFNIPPPAPTGNASSIVDRLRQRHQRK